MCLSVNSYSAEFFATTEDKNLMKKALNNTSWTSADAERIGLLLNRPAMCMWCILKKYFPMLGFDVISLLTLHLDAAQSKIHFLLTLSG